MRASFAGPGSGGLPFYPGPGRIRPCWGGVCLRLQERISIWIAYSSSRVAAIRATSDELVSSALATIWMTTLFVGVVWLSTHSATH